MLNTFYHDGSLSDLESYIIPFTNIPQMFNQSASTTYDQIFTTSAADENSPQCIDNQYRNLFSVHMDTYDPVAMQGVYNTWNTLLTEPDFSNGNIFFESYGNQAVVAVADANTAVPGRKFKVVE